MLKGKKAIKKLKLPIIKKGLPEPLPLAMDDCLRLIMFNWKYLPHPKLSKKEEMRLRVMVPFVKK